MAVQTPESVLKQYWGYDEFRPAQLEVIQAVLAGQDALVIMATGSGKSIWCAWLRLRLCGRSRAQAQRV